MTKVMYKRPAQSNDGSLGTWPSGSPIPWLSGNHSTDMWPKNGVPLRFSSVQDIEQQRNIREDDG